MRSVPARAQGPELVDRIVAVVDDEAILASDLEREGDAFDTRKIRDSRSKIRGLGYFKSVDVETSQGSADDRAVPSRARPAGPSDALYAVRRPGL